MWYSYSVTQTYRTHCRSTITTAAVVADPMSISGAERNDTSTSLLEEDELRFVHF